MKKPWFFMLIVAAALLANACDDDSSHGGGSGGSAAANTGGTSAGASGVSGSSGSVGRGGSLGSGNAAGSGGAGGNAGSGNTSGTGASGSAGSAGQGGTVGSGGSGNAGSGGSGGGNRCEMDCAAMGFTCCGTTCVNTRNDVRNCGRCGNVCTSAFPHCDGEKCARPMCDPLIQCGPADRCCNDACCDADQLCCVVPGGPDGPPQCVTPSNGTCPVGCPTCP
jgi:hypothetical protein